ncbi:MAG: o-succinylbenzoate synthase [Planctomycetaceae bacterium]|nr:o-succinylbenzoate synthase [Planctomycetaceae bacterium]
MKIDRIELFHVAMPLIYPWRTAYGEDHEINGVLCRMTSSSVDGWGESVPFAAPCYSPEWSAGIFQLAKDWLGPALLGKDIESGEQLQAELSLFKGNQFAKAIFDTAWWSLQSKIKNTPLHRLLGATRDSVPVGADYGVMDSIDDLLAGVGAAVDARFPRIKLKFRPGWDTPMLEVVRKQHPDHPIHIDCNSGYTIEDIDLFRDIDRFNLEMIEQPLPYDDIVDHAQLQAAISTPVCLDETIKSPRIVQRAIAQKSCQYVNIKPGRVGGITNAVAIHDICKEAGIPCWVGGMLESATGSSLCVALSMLDNFTYPADIFPSSRFYHEDLADPPLELCKLDDGTPGVAAVEKLPEPVSDRLEKLTIESTVIS